jgi:hypothetical protein
MKESYREKVAHHTDPESCASRRKATDEAWTGAHADPALSCEIKSSGTPTPLRLFSARDTLARPYPGLTRIPAHCQVISQPMLVRWLVRRECLGHCCTYGKTVARWHVEHIRVRTSGLLCRFARECPCAKSQHCGYGKGESCLLSSGIGMRIEYVADGAQELRSAVRFRYEAQSFFDDEIRVNGVLAVAACGGLVPPDFAYASAAWAASFVLRAGRHGITHLVNFLTFLRIYAEGHHDVRFLAV